VEQRLVGRYNAVGPTDRMSVQQLAQGCIDATGSDATLVSIPTDKLLSEYGVRPWSDLPVWVPQQGDYAGFGTRNTDKARQQGLTFRSLKDTVQGTLEWFDALDPDTQARFLGGLDPDREAQIIEAWKSSTPDG